MVAARAVPALLCLSLGCALVRAPILAESTFDAGRTDAAPALDADLDASVDPTDAGAPDAGEADAGEPDAGEPDAGPPDAGPPDVPPPSCDSLYGAATGYVLCAERATECEFVSQLDSMRTCGTTCAALGGRCIDAYRNEVPFPTCERQGGPMSCDVIHFDDICICSRGP